MSFPEAFIESLKEVTDRYQDVLDGLQQQVPVSIRVNPAKLDITLNNPIDWCNGGFYLNDRPPFFADPLWHCGAYYVQEAGSMFLSHIYKQLNLNDPLVLDMCAAPGGKSTLLLSEMEGRGLLVANETIGQRQPVLRENLVKWGHHNMLVTGNDPEKFRKLTGLFDLVVVDAPCSGEGMFRKDDQAVGYWDESLVELCAARQKRILDHAMECLAEGGYLIYSTCTFNRSENEDVIATLKEKYDLESVPVDTTAWPEIETSDNANATFYRFFPGVTKSEGFCCCVLRKISGSKFRPSKIKARVKQVVVPEIGNTGLFEDTSGKLILFPERFSALLHDLNVMNPIQTGIYAGDLIHGKFKPSDQLGFSTVKAFEGRELDYRTAINFLRKEAIPALGNGITRVVFRGVTLGYVNDLGNRVNNLYPKNWRLRKEVEVPFTLVDLK